MVLAHAAPSPQNFENRLLFCKRDGGVDTKTFGRKVIVKRALGGSQKWTLALHLINCVILGELIHFLVPELLHVKKKIWVTNTNRIL